ncbi:Uncharacterised protein [Mycoplasmopsis citelli]|uniref:Uncharacterized protein n=1 Tax=Mycoplasmopsis citelli TaxID=171281 RepID=A0A449B1J1_9BACT|nr:DUF6037 family protein [Mycoplasmopsis citelli]VEU74462.1 Uncharacterised protein [Mycoplasmopsis citelli]
MKKLNILYSELWKLIWSITSFLFKYNNDEYVLLLNKFVNGIKKQVQYALVKLEFFNTNNLSKKLICKANPAKLIANKAKIIEIRKFFNVYYQSNLEDFLKEFTKEFAKQIPNKINRKTTKVEKRAKILSRYPDKSKDINCIYCYGLYRNPKGRARNSYNSWKAEILRRELYEKFKGDSTISFLFSCKKEREKGNEEIITNFAKRAKNST